MATKYIEVDGSMLDDVYELVSAFVNPDSTYERWALALDPPWNDGRYPSGAAAVVDGRMVAYLGLLFVDREVNGKPMKVCNVHSLITLPEHRGAAARLMLRHLKRREWSYTVFTPSRAVRDFLPGVGFLSMRERVQVAPTLRGLPEGTEADSPGGDGVAAVEFDEAVLLGQVGADRAQLIEDHRDTLCRHLYVADDGGDCHVAYVVSSHPRPHAAVLSISNPAVFTARSRQIRRALRQEHRVEAMLVDTRMLGLRVLPGATVLPFDARRFVRPGTDSPPARWIDNLYSEFPLLGVPFLPGPIDETRQILLPRLSQAKTYLSTRLRPQ
jgi:hypothetical protein